MPAKATPQSEIITYKHKLVFPFTSADGTEIKEITLRRAKVKDVRKAQDQGKSAADTEVILVSIISGLLPEDIEEIDIEDWNAIQEKMGKK